MHTLLQVWFSLITLSAACWMLHLAGAVRLLGGSKDGGESKVSMWGFECKALFSVLLLRFDYGSREAFHTHAFGSRSLVLSGLLVEDVLDQYEVNTYAAGSLVTTKRTTFHKVRCLCATSWVLTIRGPWADTWQEYLPQEHANVLLTHGRKVLTKEYV